MKYTLLELTQAILSSMDSDEVNSISDTVESMQVANLIKTTYFDIIYRAKLPEHYDIISLEASTDSTKPVIMTIPTSVNKVEWVKYDKKEDDADPILMEEVSLVDLQTFLEITYDYNLDDTNVESFTYTFNGNTYTFYYKNDVAPTYYTCVSDNVLIFDSYDSTLDTTLQKSKTLCLGRVIPSFTMSDTFTPDLDAEQFPLLLNEAKILAWAELRQSNHALAERSSRRAWTHLQKNKNQSETLSDFDKLPNFGRR